MHAMGEAERIAKRVKRITKSADHLMTLLCTEVVEIALPGRAQWTHQELAETVAPHARALANDAVTVLCRAGLVKRSGEDWTRSFEAIGGLEGGYLAIEDAVQSQGEDPFFENVRLWWKGLRSFLAGEKTGPEVLFPRGNLGPWAALHGQSDLMRHYAELAAETTLDRLADGGRILEVGAGTGAALRALAAQSACKKIGEYIFTDVSSAFFDFADPANFPFPVTRQLLDFDKAPDCHAVGNVDVVLGVNAVHAAYDLDLALRNLSMLLGDNGRLVLGEGNGGSDWSVSPFFAMLPGWWNVRQGVELRPKGGFLSMQKWQEALDQAGFRFDHTAMAATFRADWHGGTITAWKRSS